MEVINCCEESNYTKDLSYENMESKMNKYSVNKLNARPYRHLQHIAKSMNLPSNVKKEYLVELIHTKECKSQKELNDLICHIKLERSQRSTSKRGKKICIQTPDVSSTSNKSPPITTTPNLNADMILQTANVQQSLLKNNRYKSNKSYPPKANPTTSSDRVLRSSHDRPNYMTMNLSNVFDLMNLDPQPVKKNKVNQGGNYPVLNVIDVDNKQPSMALDTNTSNQVNPPSTNELRSANKRARKISGISPLVTPERPQTYTRIMNFIHQDGKMTCLKGFVERPTSQINSNVSDMSNCSQYNKHGTSVIVRVLKDTELSNKTDKVTNSQEGNDKSIYTVDLIIQKPQNTPEGNLTDTYETVNTQMQGIDNNTEVLPQINNTFSIFNDASDRSLLKPIYVHVCESAEETASSPIYTTIECTASNYNNDGGFLENLYNFKSQYITSSESLQRIATTSNTTCVFSTATVTTPVQQVPATVTKEHNACDLLMQDKQYDTTLYESSPFDEQDSSSRNVFICNEVLNSSTSLETVNSQDIPVNVGFPQMVEDALDLISQDREYMERVEMHMCMQCFFCPWAGSKLHLESHLRQYHMSDIETFNADQWVTTYTLGGLVQREVWLCRVVQYESVLYVLSAKYEDPDIFMASVNNITTEVENISKLANITTFNKVTGEPFTWEGPVEELPHTMPYYKDTDCFKLELSKMDLLPNSANLQLMNCELVTNSPTKVVVGQPALHDIHINLFIKLSDIVASQNESYQNNVTKIKL